jgi:hypothetical protein
MVLKLDAGLGIFSFLLIPLMLCIIYGIYHKVTRDKYPKDYYTLDKARAE